MFVTSTPATSCRTWGTRPFAVFGSRGSERLAGAARDLPAGSRLGFGVTAVDRSDAGVRLDCRNDHFSPLCGRDTSDCPSNRATHTRPTPEEL